MRNILPTIANMQASCTSSLQRGGGSTKGQGLDDLGLVKQWVMQNDAACRAMGSTLSMFDAAFKSVSSAARRSCFQCVWLL